MSRLQPVRAYWRRVPDRVNTPPHSELFAAREKELIDAGMASLSKELERELDAGEER